MNTSHSIIPNVPHTYLFYYVSNQYLSLVTDFSRHLRQRMFEFKDGRNQSDFIDSIIKTLEHHHPNFSGCTLACIPASTTDANQRRYEFFSDSLSSKLGMTNSYSHIRIVREKDPKHCGGTVPAVYSYDKSFFKGRKIVIFDDIVTTGTSMITFARDLESLGADIVATISLAKTYNPAFSTESNPIHPFYGTPLLQAFNAPKPVLLAKPKSFYSQILDTDQLIPNESLHTRSTLRKIAFGQIKPSDTQKKSEFVEKEVTSTLPSIKVPRIGAHLKLGTYDGHPISWMVLDVSNDKALLISDIGLTSGRYNDNLLPTTWADSTLRKWLNEQFFYEAFSSAEQSRICLHRVKPEVDERHELYAGPSTEDHVFLLSILEYEKYYLNRHKKWVCKMPDGRLRQCWLRNYGLDRTRAAFIGRSGSIHAGGSLVNSSRNAIRPMIWIKY